MALSGALAVTVASCAPSEDITPAPRSDARPSEGVGESSLEPGYEADCHLLCDAMIERGCDDETCAPGCVSANESAEECATVLGAYVACLADHVSDIPSCYDYPPECESAYLDWASCAAPGQNGCGPIKCDDVGVGACSCWGICRDVVVRETCTDLGVGFECTCEVDGEQVATCQSELQCAFFVGCCAPHIPK
jgi:hypothetical protein